MLYVDVDLNECVEPKQFHDLSGGYNRFDVFQLTVNRSALRPIQFVDDLALDKSECSRPGESSEQFVDLDETG